MDDQQHARRILIFQPRTETGVPLAFSLAEDFPGFSVHAFAMALFGDHLTAATIEVFDEQDLVDAFRRPGSDQSDSPFGKVTP